MKKYAISLLMSFLFVLLAACGSSDSTDAANSSQAGESNTHNLRLAHSLNKDHPVHLALVRFKEIVEERSNGQINIEIFSNGVLGDEREVLEQLQAGGVDITKVSAASLGNFASQYAVFSLPYVFTDEDHFFRSMESDAVQELFNSTADEGFLGLTWYDSGARSFYTKETPIMHPDDLQGLRIRVMSSQTQIEMMRELGGAPTPMAYGEIYTALQSGVIDGAESNPTALTNGKHGEVAPHFSFDEHTRIPDIAIISSKVWQDLSEEQRQIVKDAAKESTEYQKEIWASAVDEAMEEAKAMGVEFYHPDLEPFREAVQPLHEKYRKDKKIAELLDAFEQLEE
ncbi:TRAP transporter substrate-binding protein [Gracilibacillus oryzae]|uniref:TRAP transporter substrate-binding protein n=1 Tax=Gracilibacillus oryzae TaxID=1672701 RepID=A0A7C8GSZ5_9BACI|nr:TRAP transporter substrate-binding protein [Gracilibacillus oryzae]KAB8134517.1 TRAP transporter substrate-binding protein [Gracilibacillus oryzae]